MKVMTTIPGILDKTIEEVEWPEGWPIPREGECVMTNKGDSLIVKHVVWNPHGEFDEKEPFVYLVLWTAEMASRNPFR